VTDSGSVTLNPNIGNDGGQPANLIQGIQTVAVTQLKQVNAGISLGNNNTMYGNGATLTANSTNSSSNGVLATSASIGVAANSAAQNVVNVSANITQRTGP
jgi:hypothetical protein